MSRKSKAASSYISNTPPMSTLKKLTGVGTDFGGWMTGTSAMTGEVESRILGPRT